MNRKVLDGIFTTPEKCLEWCRKKEVGRKKSKFPMTAYAIMGIGGELLGFVGDIAHSHALSRWAKEAGYRAVKVTPHLESVFRAGTEQV